MRLGFAVASHLTADVLLLDEVFAVGDERSSASASTRSSTSSATAARSCSSRTTRRRSNGSASADAPARGSVAFDGATHDAMTEYHRLLADERDPAELAAGLSEWGSGEARIADVRVRGAAARSATQFLSGEPLSLAIEARSRVGRCRRRGCPTSCATSPDRLLAGGGVDTDERRLAGRSAASSPCASTSTRCRSPTGASISRSALAGPDAGTSTTASSAGAVRRLPPRESAGAVLLEGRWSAGEVGAPPN